MIEPGAVLAALSVAAIAAAALPGSRVALDLARVARSSVPAAPGSRAPRRVGAMRAVLAVSGAGLAVAIGAPFLAPLLGYTGYLAPALLRDRHSANELRQADRALLGAVEWADALVAAGRPAERALLAVARHGTGAPLLDRTLAAAADASSLGAPLFRVLSSRAGAAGLTPVKRLADELERSRDLGAGSRTVISDARDRLRSEARARALAAASRVETKLMLVLVLCYLPALMLVVVVPLFVGLLAGMLG